MKKTVAALIAVVALFAGSVSFAGNGKPSGGLRTEAPTPCQVLNTTADTLQPNVLSCDLM
jgi:hypothetical protein